jgi:hypothetical protein
MVLMNDLPLNDLPPVAHPSTSFVVAISKTWMPTSVGLTVRGIDHAWELLAERKALRAAP